MGAEARRLIDQTRWISMAELKASFKDEFQERIVPGDAYQRAISLKQKPDKNLQTFARSFEKLISYMTPKIGMPSIINAFLQTLRFELASAASIINCRNLPWSQMINKLVEIKRRLPKKQAWINPNPTYVNMAQFHEARADKRQLDPNDRPISQKKDKFDAFKRRCRYPDSKGCWICNAPNHFTRDCPNKLLMLPKPAD